MENNQTIYEAMIEKFVAWAEPNRNIRLALVWGSRVRKTNPADEWSDLDLIMVADHPDEILLFNDWLGQMGNPKVAYLENTLGHCKELRVLFDNGIDIDFPVFPCRRFKEIFNTPEVLGILSRGVRILFDKDNLMADLKVSDEYIPAQSLPNQEEFTNSMNAFWYHSVWTAKKLRRGELFQAKYACDVWIKHLLTDLIKWQTYCKKDQDYDTWHGYRFFERWVDPVILKKMQHIYAHYDQEDIWNALFATMNLFREIAKETAVLLKYPYPMSADDYATEYVSILSQER